MILERLFYKLGLYAATHKSAMIGLSVCITLIFATGLLKLKIDVIFFLIKD
jgi:hypothetical protein